MRRGHYKQELDIPLNEHATETKCQSDESVQTAKRVDISTDIAEAAPDGGWGWFVMIGCLLVHVVVGKYNTTQYFSKDLLSIRFLS